MNDKSRTAAVTEWASLIGCVAVVMIFGQITSCAKAEADGCSICGHRNTTFTMRHIYGEAPSPAPAAGEGGETDAGTG